MPILPLTATVTDSTGASASGTVNVTVLPSGTWPTEPAGLPVLSDYGFSDNIPTSSADQAIPGTSGWRINYNGTHSGAIARRTTDPSAPFSAPDVLELPFPSGFQAGTGPATLYKPLPGVRTLYAGFWVKVNAGWQGAPNNVNKLCYAQTNAGSMYVCFYGTPGGPYELRLFPQFTGVSLDLWYRPTLATRAFTVGEWHRVEWLVQYAGGRIAMALDGVKLTDVTGVPMPSAGLSEYQIAAVWSGTGAKTQQDYMWFDHVRLSGS